MTTRDTGIHVEGLRELFRTMSKMGGQISDDVRAASTDLAEDFLGSIRPATIAERRAMSAFRVYRDRIPKVGFPKSAKAGVSGGATAGQLFFGTEFGGRARPTTQQFPPHTGRTGRFFYPELRSSGRQLADAWFDMVADELEQTWNRGARSAASS